MNTFTKEIEYLDGQPYVPQSLIYAPVDEPTPGEYSRCLAFRCGQRDRKAGEPCKSANGAYLDGWYDPSLEVPPYVSSAQAQAFNL